MVNLYGIELPGTGLAGDLFSCDTVTVVSNDIVHRRPIFRLALFLVSAILILLALNTLYSFTSTLNRLDVVESERDRWQRPLDVLRVLDLRPGNTVVDLGSGAGYFALKLSSAVGERGQVLAVDLRKLSLFSCGRGRYCEANTMFRSSSAKKTILACQQVLWTRC